MAQAVQELGSRFDQTPMVEHLQTTMSAFVAGLRGDRVYLGYIDRLPRIPKARKLISSNGIRLVNVGLIDRLKRPLAFHRQINGGQAMEMGALTTLDIGELAALLTEDGRFFCRPLERIDRLYRLISDLKMLGNVEPNNPEFKPNPFMNGLFVYNMEHTQLMPLSMIKTQFLSRGNLPTYPLSGRVYSRTG